MNSHLVRTFSRSLSWAAFSLAVSAIAQDLSVNGNLSVTGDTDLGGNTLSLGTRADSSTTPGLNLLYGDAAAPTIYFNATRSGAQWLWQQNGTSPQMKLTSSNQLLLFSTTNATTPAVTLAPAGTSTFSGPVQFQGTVTMNGNSVTNLNASNITTGILPMANGGTGTAAPGLIAGSNVTITGTWPNQTISALPAETDNARQLGNGLSSGVSWDNALYDLWQGSYVSWHIGDLSFNYCGAVFGDINGNIFLHPVSGGAVYVEADYLYFFGNGNATISSNGSLTLAAGNSQNLILSPESGNVGIGTTTPFAKLDVTGDARVDFVTLGRRVNSTGLNFSTTGLTQKTVAEVRAAQSDGPPALAWHYEGRATRHVRMEQNGTLNVVAPTNENSGQAVLAVNGTPVLTTTGNGSGLTNLNASAVTSGTITAARLPVEVVQLTTAQTLANKTLTSPTLSGASLTGNTVLGGTTPTQQVLVDSTGNVGIGTSSPGAKLNVAGNLRVGADGSSNEIRFYGTTGDVSGGYDHTVIAERLYAGSDRSELLFFHGNDADLTGQSNANWVDRIRFDTPGAIVFQTGINDRKYNPSVGGNTVLTLNSAGRVLVGTTTDDGVNRLQVNGGAAIAGTVKATNVTATNMTADTVTVKAVLRIPPSGDLSMGGFTTGTNPAN